MQGKDNLIATWVYLDPIGQESQYSQVPGVSSNTDFQAIYWRCVATFFATSIRNNPQAQHVLFTNADHLPIMGDFDLQAFLSRQQVEVIRVSNTHLPPPGYYGAWRNQFYVFDIIQHLAATLSPETCCIVLDSDCVWVRGINTMEEAIRRVGLLTYDIGLKPGWPQNGLTPEEMKLIYEELSGSILDHFPVYIGGELFAATGEAARRVAAEIPPLWDEMMEAHRQGRLKFNEEAHALSYLYHKLDYPSGTANPFIKRIWTGLLYEKNVSARDLELTIWHVPVEKRFGLGRLFTEVRNPVSRFWSIAPGSELAHYVGSYLGIPRRSPAKLIRDVRKALREKGSPGAIVSAMGRALRQNMTHLLRRIWQVRS